jgi:hypothetical protein
MQMRSLPSRPLTLALLTLAALPACDKPMAIGDSENVVVAARDSVWTGLRAEIQDAIEPQIFTVRDEAIFEVSQVDPTTAPWGDLRHIRRVLVIGEASDPWVAEALEAARAGGTAPPALIHTRNVWARNQNVAIVLLAPGTDPDASGALIREAGTAMVEQYETESRRRMFATGVDSTTADSIRRTAGFWLLAPEVYRVVRPEENVVMMRNDNPDPSQLIRQVHLTWRPAGEIDASPEAALAWRRELAERVTQPPQVTQPEIAQVRRLRQNDRPTVEIHGIWSNPPGEWPAAGPFIARMIECPDRTYLVDAWLYAPGRSKYPYMIQLNTLLDSFRCG